MEPPYYVFLNTFWKDNYKALKVGEHFRNSPYAPIEYYSFTIIGYHTNLRIRSIDKRHLINIWLEQVPDNL